MQYRTTRQYTRGSESNHAQFDDLDTAKAAVQNQLREDKRLNVKITYRIYFGSELLLELTPDDAIEAGGSAGQADSSGRGKSQNFRPTPLNTSPRPPGSPPNWWSDDKEEDDKK